LCEDVLKTNNQASTCAAAPRLHCFPAYFPESVKVGIKGELDHQHHELYAFYISFFLTPT
jgi:hypothetical protein